MSKSKSDRIKHASKEIQAAVAKLPDILRNHTGLIEAVGVARPGKTAHDKATGAWSKIRSRHGKLSMDDDKGNK